MPNIKGQTQPFETTKASATLDLQSNEMVANITYELVNVESEQTALLFQLGVPHPRLGIPETNRSATWVEGICGYEVNVTFKGRFDIDGDDPDEYTLDVSFGEEPIESHPNLEAIKDFYKGTPDADGNIKFTEYLDQNNGTGLSAGGGGNRKNPMFGVKTYLVLKAVLRHSYYSKSRPDLSTIREIVDTVPGGYDTPSDYNWLRMPPKSKRIGKEDFHITDEYLLSEKGGWPPHVHGLINI